MPANNKPKPEPKKTMDVAKPGKSSPDASSRPVLVTHKPMIQDPMVKSDEEVPTDIPKVEEEAKAISSHNKVIAPLDTKPSEEVSAAPEEVSDEPQASSGRSAMVDAVAEQAEEEDKQNGVLTAEQRKQQDELNKLIQSKKYFVPIGQVTKRKNNRRLLAALVIVALLLIGAYLAVDAGLIKTGYDVPFNFIQE